MNLAQHRTSKDKPTGQGLHKCYACGRPGHSTGDKLCPARGKLCVSVAREGTGQRVAGTRQMEKGNRVRVMEKEVRVIIGDPVVL